MTSPPIANRKRKELTIGQNKIIDYYDWLRKKNSKEVLDYLDAENQYTERFMRKKGITSDKNYLLNKMKHMMVEDYDTVKLPEDKDGWDSHYRFFSRYQKGKKYPKYMYENTTNGKETMYLNPNKEQKPGQTLLSTTPNFNESLTIVGIAYNYDGDELYTVKLYSFPEMTEIKHNLPEILYGDFSIFGNDIYYCKHNKETGLMYELIKYNLVTKRKETIYTVKDDETKSIYFYINDDYKYLIYGWGNYEENELYYLPLQKPFDINDRELILKSKKSVTYTAKIIGDYIIILGNLGKCINNCLFYRKLDCKTWKQLVQYENDNFMEDIYVIKDGLLVIGRKYGCQFMRYIHLENYIESKSFASSTSIINNKFRIKDDYGEVYGNDGYFLSLYYCDSNSAQIAFGLEDMRTPTTIYTKTFDKKHKYNHEEELWTKPINNYNLKDYEVKRLWIKSEEYQLPVDILRRKGLKQHTKDKKILLYSYSSYGISTDNKFDLTRFPLVDEGFEYAILNVRGSSYLGKSFYKEGKLLKRMNTFTDVNNIAEYFVKRGYKVNLEGRSAGGLLASASSLLRPELYTSVIAIVPFVDVLLTMSDATIPLTLGEWSEVGNTNISHIYNYVKHYSPVHIVEEDTCYPNYYIEGGFNDARVAYWQPAKLVAKLRHAMSNLDHNKLILLKINMDGGHFNAYERYKMIESVAEKYAFLIKTNE
jgi:oligopeptidase B